MDKIINFFGFPLSYLKFWKSELASESHNSRGAHINADETTFIYNAEIRCALVEEFAFMLNRKCSPMRVRLWPCVPHAKLNFCNSQTSLSCFVFNFLPFLFFAGVNVKDFFEFVLDLRWDLVVCPENAKRATRVANACANEDSMVWRFPEPTKETPADVDGDTKESRPIVDPASRTLARNYLEVGLSTFTSPVIWIIKFGAMQDACHTLIDVVDVSATIDAFEFYFHILDLV
jgi:hypothetical protein